MERILCKSRMTVWIYLVAWIPLCFYTSGVWSIDMCSDESETTRRNGELTHSEYPEWTDERGCQCNISANSNVHLTLRVSFQYETKRNELCIPKGASHIQISHRKSAPLLVCSSDTTNASLTMFLHKSDSTSISLYNSYSRKLRFNVEITADEDVTIECGAIAVVALLPVTEADEGGGYTGPLAALVIGLILVIGLCMSRCMCTLLDYKEKCNCLFPRTEEIYSSQDYNDGVGDNPAYEVTPQSSVASSTVNMTSEKGLQPNGKHISFPEGPQNGSATKPGFINRAFGSKPLASFRKHKYRPELLGKQNPNSFYTDTSGMAPAHTFGPQDNLSIERYDTPPESLEPSIVPDRIYPVSANPVGTDPNMNKINEPLRRTSVPGSQDRPLEVGIPRGNGKPPAPENNNPYLPFNAYKSPVNDKQPGQPPVVQPHTAHPDYPHYGNIAPPFNVSADSIVYMDLDEMDDFFLRQKRKPEVGFRPDPSQRYTPMITKLYQPPGVQQGRDIPAKTAAKFQPINTPAAPSKSSHPFVPRPDDSMLDNSHIAHDIMQSPIDRDLQSPASSQYASPMDTPTHRPYDPASSITSSPSHAGYMTPPQDLVEMRRSSASPHLDNLSLGSKAFETDV